MKKTLLFLFVAVLASPKLQAQYVPPIDTIFTENFDGAFGPDSIDANYNTYTLNGLKTWNDTNFLKTTGTRSFHTRLYANDSIVFETDDFSTLGYTNVRFTFDHICKIRFVQKGFIQMSRDNGATWVNLDSNHYKGNSLQFPALGWFNENSYPAPTLTPYWYGPTITSASATAPTNSWWASETFDLSNYLGAYDAVNDTDGFANCKIRFIANYSTSSPFTISGWYVDNLMVEAAPCELDPPTLDWVNVTVQNKPDGARFMPTQDVRVKGEDNVGIDSVKIFYRWDTTSVWSSAMMSTTSGGSCPTSGEWTHTFTGIDVYDTVDWYVEIYDCACPNVVRDPDYIAPKLYYTFWRDPAPPPICGTTTQTTFPYIGQLPFEEDFESPLYWVAGTGSGDMGVTHRGDFPDGNPPVGKNWTVSPNETTTGFAWSIRKGSTGTTFTGPDADATKGNSTGVYLYTEASQGVNNDKAILITPCIDLQGYGCASMEFKYHMYGMHSRKIRIDIDTGTNVPAWVNQIAFLNNEDQTSSSDPWKNFTVNLDEYLGDIVRIRFVGIRGTGARADMSIDDIRIIEPNPTDIALRDVLNPNNGYCWYSNNELLDLWIQNNGCQDADSIPISYKVDYTNTSGNISTTTHTEYVTHKTLELGDTANFSFATGPDLSGYGTYSIWVYSGMPGDTVNTNDTIGPIYIEHEQPYASFPYFIDFDGAGTTAGTNTAVNPGSFPNTVWTPVPASNSGNFAFMVGTGYSPSVNTGPLFDASVQGNYLVTEGDYGSAPTSATLESKCLDLDGLTTPVVQFKHHMYGADIGAVRLQWKRDGENFWSNVPGGALTTLLTDEKDDWQFMEYDLSTQAGNIVKLRLVGQKSGVGVAADIAIDDLVIFDKATTDVGLMRVSQPSERVNLAGGAAGKTFKTVIQNFGKNSVTGVPISYTVTPTCGANAGVSTTYNFNYTGTIAAGAAVTAEDVTNTVNWPTGTFEIYAWTNKSGDNINRNDSTYWWSVGWPDVYINDGFEDDFEVCSFGDSSGFWVNGDLRLFEVGQINALGGNQGYATKPNGYVPGGVAEYLYFPKFIGFDTIAGAKLSITQDIDLGAGDAAVIEYLTAGTWKTLGFWDPNEIVSKNWYNDPSGNKWTGNLGTIVSQWPLAFYNFSSAPLILRAKLVTTGGNKDGWNIDKIGVIIPPQNSASPRKVETVEYLPMPLQNNHIKAVIRNTGAKVLDSCMAEYSVDGGTTWSQPEKVVFNPPLIPGKQTWYTFDQPWVNPTSGSHNVCVRTSLPDSKPDNDPSDDQLCSNIVVLDRVVMSTDSSYCNDFDDPSVAPWLTLNTFLKGGLTSWEFGTPNSPPIVGAYSGTNSWMTKLDTLYKRRDSSSLYTPVFVMDSGQTYTFEFMHAFSTELYHDGGTVDITFDGGLNWHTVGNILYGATWFNTTYVTSLDVIKPGWSGVSNGWEQARINLAIDSSKQGVFRFRFASDETFAGSGWAIDDFCFYSTDDQDADVYVIGEEELAAHVGVGRLHPNPTTNATRLPIAFQQPGDVVITVRNAQGQLIMQRTEHGEEGMNVFELNTQNWAAGMYLVEALTPNGVSTQRLVVE